MAQWANVDINNKNYGQAEDKTLRALFIRHQLGDVKNSLILLQQLQTIYIATENKKEALTEHWIEKLSSPELNNWENLFSDFDTYPGLENTIP